MILLGVLAFLAVVVDASRISERYIEQCVGHCKAADASKSRLDCARECYLVEVETRKSKTIKKSI